MKTKESIKSILSENKTEIVKAFGIKRLSLFGSYVRNEQKESSDLDILVEFEEVPTFFEFIRLEDYLSKLLGIKVDLVMKEALKANIGKHILNEAIAI